MESMATLLSHGARPSGKVDMSESRIEGWRRVLAEMCERNAAIELTVGAEESNGRMSPPIIASRLLRIAPNRLCIEVPHGPRLAARLTAGTPLTVLAIDQQTRLFLKYTVAER